MLLSTALCHESLFSNIFFSHPAEKVNVGGGPEQPVGIATDAGGGDHAAGRRTHGRRGGNAAGGGPRGVRAAVRSSRHRPPEGEVRSLDVTCVQRNKREF